MAAVEIVTFAGAAGPPMSRLEKCPPNWTVWLRAPAEPIASASSAGLAGLTTSVQKSGMTVEDHVPQNVAEERRQESLHGESRHEDGCQLQEECVQDQQEKA